MKLKYRCHSVERWKHTEGMLFQSKFIPEGFRQENYIPGEFNVGLFSDKFEPGKIYEIEILEKSL